MNALASTAAADIADKVLARLHALLPTQRPLPLHEPQIGKREKQHVDDCLNSGWISTAGPYVDRFERAIAEYTGIEQVTATVNGTAALHACLVLAGITADDEVLVPALTFVGTLNPIAYQQATPHLIDCDINTLGVDPVALQSHLETVAERRDGQCFNRHTGRRIGALLVVHILGIPADMPALAEIAEDWHLTLIEDAAEALGSWRDGQHAGSWGQLAALSFNGNKIISSGGGGAVLCHDKALAERVRHLCTTAKHSHPYRLIHDQVAFNYRLPNINAALGYAQFQHLDQYLIDKHRLYRHYAEGLAGLTEVFLHQPPQTVQSNHWLNLLLMPTEQARDKLLEMASAEGLMLRPFWDPMHQLPMYADCPRAALPNTEQLWQRGICLPSSPHLMAAING